MYTVQLYQEYLIEKIHSWLCIHTVVPFLQNYENMFYSYYFNTGPVSKKRFETRFKTGAGKNPITSAEERWLGMSFNSMFDGKGIKTHGRPNLNVVIGK